MPKITFQNSDHSYFDNQQIEYKSVSKIFKSLEPEFDAQAIAERKILKDLFPKDYAKYKRMYGWESPLVQEYLKKLIDPLELEEKVLVLTDSWQKYADIRKNLGTSLHKQEELKDIANGFKWNKFDGRRYQVVNPPKTHDNESLHDDLSQLEPGYYPELLIFCESHKIAGQADGVFIDFDKSVVIRDLKTDEVIQAVPDFYHPKKGYEKYRSPINHLNRCNMNMYSIKMSFYGWMLEQFGLKVKGMYIDNLKMDTDNIPMNVLKFTIPYRPTDVYSILNP